MEAGRPRDLDSTVYCGTCWFCRRGEINLCDNRRVLGVSCDDYRRHGAFAEYVAVPQHILLSLPHNVTFEQAAMIEPLSIAFHAVGLTRVVLGDTAVVIGAGMIGLLVIQALRASGSGQIIAIDVDQRRLDLARKFGADGGFLCRRGGRGGRGPQHNPRSRRGLGRGSGRHLRLGANERVVRPQRRAGHAGGKLDAKNRFRFASGRHPRATSAAHAPPAASMLLALI